MHTCTCINLLKGFHIHILFYGIIIIIIFMACKYVHTHDVHYLVKQRRAIYYRNSPVNNYQFNGSSVTVLSGLEL